MYTTIKSNRMILTLSQKPVVWVSDQVRHRADCVAIEIENIFDKTLVVHIVANNTCPDQTVRMRRLILAMVVHTGI